MGFNIARPVMILVRGLPGSGKSYIASRLADAIGRDSVVALDPDAIDYDSQAYTEHVKVLDEEGVDKSLHAYRFLRGQAYKGIAEGKITIWNQPFTNLEIFNKMVANFMIQANEHQVELAILLVEVEIDPTVAKNRVMDRKRAGGHGPSDNTFDRFTRDYQSFVSEGYNVVKVNGNDQVNISVDAVLSALKKLR